MTETNETLAKLAMLREPFPESEIRYLPRVWCRACRDSKRGCNQHEMSQCSKCGNRLTTAHIDLKFVGHAEVTNRLLNVDPMWSWEPVAFDSNGLPQYDGNRGLWIRLTVCGVTRLGYGNAEGKSGGDAVKEIIGDAIRNAGMRFGMALDLWTSSDLEIVDNRDFVAEAEQCTTADCVVDVFREAQDAGASAAVLNKIKAIGMQLRAVEAPPVPEGRGEESQDPHAAAVSALREFAAERGLTDIDAAAYEALGAPLDDVAADVVWGWLKQLQTNA